MSHIYTQRSDSFFLLAKYNSITYILPSFIWFTIDKYFKRDFPELYYCNKNFNKHSFTYTLVHLNKGMQWIYISKSDWIKNTCFWNAGRYFQIALQNGCTSFISSNHAEQCLFPHLVKMWHYQLFCM